MAFVLCLSMDINNIQLATIASGKNKYNVTFMISQIGALEHPPYSMTSMVISTIDSKKSLKGKCFIEIFSKYFKQKNFTIEMLKEIDIKLIAMVMATAP